jgi:diguanylate cyclase (GGDEF)-like protein
LIGALATTALLLGIWLFLRYHQERQTELAGFSTAKALAQQVVIQRRIYTEQVVARARRAGMAVDLDFATLPGAIPPPVTLVNLSGEAIAQEIPGAQIRLFSRHPFAGKPLVLDRFEDEALARFEAGSATSWFRIEETASGLTARYALVDRMSDECVACHNAHPQSPRRDWKVGDVRGAVEVAVPMSELAERMSAEQRSFEYFLVAGGAVFILLVTLFVRYDWVRSRRERDALTDPVTQLPTRRAAQASISAEVVRAHRYRSPLSFVMLDLDHFKKINDQFGHAQGDAVLAGVGKVLLDHLREFDLAARWGGEEFLVVLPAVAIDGARATAERLRVLIRAIDCKGVTVTVSAGVAELGEGETLDAAIARADQRLYDAKQGGRDRVC